MAKERECDCTYVNGARIMCKLHRQMNDHDPADDYTWSEDILNPTHQARIEVER